MVAGRGRKWAAWSLALLSPWLLAGCPAAVVGAAAGGAVVANDERTAGSFLEDELIELKNARRPRRGLRRPVERGRHQL